VQRLFSLFGALAMGCLLTFARPVHAQTKLPRAGSRVALEKQARKFAGRVAPLLDLAEFLDRVTERRGGPRARLTRRATLKSLHLEARFHVPQVEVEDYLTNRVFGREVPGRRVAVKVRVDCEVRCSLDLGKIKVRLDRDYPDTVEIILPDFEVTATFPKGAEATYEVDYGRLRSPYIDSGAGAGLRKEMYKEVKRQAVEEFTQGSLSTYRREVARELQRQLRSKFPRARIHVK
jgi:hypothetical protein